MIRYRLTCRDEHVFDEWFSSSADFDARKERGALICPTCGDSGIEKTIMAPNLGRSGPIPDAPPCEGGTNVAGCCGGGCLGLR